MIETSVSLPDSNFRLLTLVVPQQRIVVATKPEATVSMIAPQVQNVVPSLVTDGDPMTLNYAGLSVVAIGAIQELHELLQDQQAIIETQNARIARLEAAMGSR
jgi:hypothetical protein